MATTTNLAIELADVGADNGTWGGITNAAFQSIDDIFKTDGTGSAVSINIGASRTLNAASGTVLLPVAASPAQTADGSVVWDSDDNLLTVGTGSARKTMCDTDTAQTLTNKTLTTPVFSGIPTGTVTAGTFTPSIANVTGTSALTAGKAQYLRVGNTVTVSGTAGFTAAFASTCQLSLTTPIASDFTASTDCAGAGGLDVGPGAYIVGDIASNLVLVTVVPGTTGAMSLSYTYTYEVK